MTTSLRSMLTAQTIGGRLLRAFLVLAALLMGSGALAYSALHGSAATAADALEVIRRDARQASALSAAVAGEIQAAGHYLRDVDSTAVQTFRRLNVETHAITGALAKQATKDSDHRALVAMVDRLLTDVESTYTRAHQQFDAGDNAAARRTEASVAEPVRQLLGVIDRLGSLTERQVTLVAAEMRREAEMRALAILIVFGLVIIVGTLLVGATLRSINQPLHQLVEHADALSRGAFDTRTSGRMPGEFQRIANALNDAGTSLGVLATATAATASELAASSNELSQVSDRIAHKATEVSHVMENVTRGAENQVGMLRQIDTELADNNVRAMEVRTEAGSVAALAETIEREAMEKRRTIGQALSVMSEIRSSVQDASRTAESLHSATEGIAQFVTSVGRIAEQTNMLALNAAIEAARAGDAGRGFVVVADEVRKLAEAAQRAADDVARLTTAITGGVNKTVSTMQRSAGLVGEIETVGRDVGTALESITTSAERTVAAAAKLSHIAAQNSAQLASVQQSLSVVARDAVGHATSAQQANASAQEQSAACQQMSAASQVLHGRSTRLRKLVETRDAANTTPGGTAEFVVARKFEVISPTVEGGTPRNVTAVTPLNNRVLNRAPSKTPTRRPPTGKQRA